MTRGFVIERIGAVLVIRFDRPEIRNPLSVRVLEGLAGIFNDHDSLADLDAVIFTGSGDSFASGADLREIAAVGPASAREFALRGQEVMDQIAETSLMTIAAVNGFCFGGGLDLALACDCRVASPNAVFSHPGTGLGIITGWGGTQRLSRLIGQANTMEMFFTAGRVNTPSALRIGLINEIAENAYGRALSIVTPS